MEKTPMFRFFIYDKLTPIHNRKKKWKEFLPQDRNNEKPLLPEQQITYGDYLNAIKSYIKKDNFEIIHYALVSIINEEIDIQDLKEINIILSKHGEFYHPSKIEIVYQDKKYFFVMNVAISIAGKSAIKHEFGILDELCNKFSQQYLPEVYGFGKTLIRKTFPVLMFLGKWFEGYHEFHASLDKNGKIKISLWDTEDGNLFLSDEEVFMVYEKISTILTVYYHMDTFRQIFPWHHAAGDFILKRDKNGVDIKLITARQYESMLEDRDNDADFNRLALLVFLLNLSIRMRLDRLDGVGEMIWLDDFLVKATLKGFFNGLTEQQNNGVIPDDFSESFKTYIKCRDREELIEIALFIVNSYNEKAPEVSLIKTEIMNHMATWIDVMENDY
ncbi:MAG: hypothetical protein KJ737_14550 [Proteobacteria bacterium]|nr:hypothetical protein [Pseudomonadota bacterium]